MNNYIKGDLICVANDRLPIVKGCFGTGTSG